MRRVLLLLAVTVAGCTSEEAAPPSYGDGLGTPESPIPQDGVPYAVHTQFDPASATVPTSIAQMTASLHQFSQAPAHTLLGLAAQAAPAQLATLDSLSSTLRSRLESWMDAEIDKGLVGGMRARDIAGQVAGFVETALTRFSLESTLTFSPASTTHTLAGLSFRLAGYDVIVPVGGLSADTIEQRVVVTVGSGGALTFGDHRFGIAFGAHAWHGINLALTTEIGSNVDAALTTSVSCRAMGQAVALKCVSGVCVGHADELTALCEQSLGSIVQAVETDVGGIEIASIHLESGTAHLVDDNGDGLANRTENGAWTPDPDLDAARATFTALAPGR